MARFGSLAVALLALTGCAVPGGTVPDLERLYESSRGAPDQPPVILIPGVMGSRLVDSDGLEIWPKSTWNVLFSSHRDLALSIDPETLEPIPDGAVATGMTDKLAGRDFYASIMQILESAGRYRHGTPGQPVEPGERHYYEFAYDWRHDNLVAIKALDTLIEQIRIDHGDPDLQVDIIAHSMGGLIARYYLRYGATDVLDDNEFPLTYHGEGRVRRVVLLGTPNLGSAESVHAFITGKRVGFRRVPPETLATFPSIYQLFLHPLNEWILDQDGQPLDRDIFDVEIWRQFEWSIFDPATRAKIGAEFDEPEEAERYLDILEAAFHHRMERARRFVWSLTVPLERVPWKLMVFGGSCHLTPARILVEEVSGESIVRLHPDEIRRPVEGIDYDRLMLEPGDGSVTKASLLARETLDPGVPRHRYSFFPTVGALFLCERHHRLTGNVNFQDNLLQFLLSRDPVILSP